MKPSIWLKIAAGLQAFGTVGHTLATQMPVSRGPQEQAVFSAMQNFHFDIMGVNRSHWDFLKGYELEITVIFAVLAVLLWQLSNLSRTNSKEAAPLIATILICQIFMSILGWMYFVPPPGIVGGLIAICLMVALSAMYRETAVPAVTGQLSPN